MKNSQTYLTEQKLGAILKSFFPESNIVAQYRPKDTRRIVDYAITFKHNSEHTPFFMKKAGIENKERKQIVLLVEFDGYMHYTSNKQVHKDGTCLQMRRVSSTLSPEIDEHEDLYGDTYYLILRLPYWLQLDIDMCKLLFGISKDESCGFPHGFVDKKCPMPELFCRAGEERFLTEMDLLPPRIQKQVLNTLIEKSALIGIFATCSNFLMEEMIRRYKN